MGADVPRSGAGARLGVGALLLLILAGGRPLRGQGRGACIGGGTGHVRVAPRVDAVFVYERCLGGDRVAAITLWRARTPGWDAAPDAVAFDQRSRLLVVRARDGAHPLSLGGSDSVLVVMLEAADAVAGPIPVQTTRLAPASAAGIVPTLAEMQQVRDRAALPHGSPQPSLTPAPTPSAIATRLRDLLARDGRSRRFIGE